MARARSGGLSGAAHWEFQMLAAPRTTAAPHAAIVAKTDVASHAEQYLVMSDAGAPAWVSDPQAASAFASLREATRMALRLPASLKAYGLPQEGQATRH